MKPFDASAGSPPAAARADELPELPDTPEPPDARAAAAIARAALDPARHRAQADARRDASDELGALAHLIAADTLDAYARGVPDASAAPLCDVATGYFMKGDHATAARWYALVLALDPLNAVACQNLAAWHASAGREADAHAWRERAYRIQRVFVETAPGQTRRVLLLSAARSAGNVPLDALLPGRVNGRIKYAIDYAADDEDARLPPYDLVFNAIGDADVAAPLAARLAHFVRGCARPLLNPPERIAQTTRERIPALLGTLDGVASAPCIRLDAVPASVPALAEVLARARIALPVLCRPAATHGGAGVARCDDLDTLWQRLSDIDGPRYVTAFHDYRSPDGYYRKYRILFVDRVPYPYHLAISPHWMVHYFSADMENVAWKLDEERRFLHDPTTALGLRAQRAVEAIGRRLDLDYGGLDCTVLADGRLFVFEANATMLAHYERANGPLAHKNPYVLRITDAFERLMTRVTSA